MRSSVVNWIVLTACTLLARNSALTGDVSLFSPRRRSDLHVTYIDINLRCRANTILVPVMASRLMLSLKKATVQPKILWSLDTMTSMGRGRSAGGRTIIFAPRVPRGLHEASRAPVAPNEGDMELGAMPRSPPSLDSHYGR